VATAAAIGSSSSHVSKDFDSSICCRCALYSAYGQSRSARLCSLFSFTDHHTLSERLIFNQPLLVGNIFQTYLGKYTSDKNSIMPRPKKEGAPEPKKRSRNGCWYVLCQFSKLKNSWKVKCSSCLTGHRSQAMQIQENQVWRGKGRMSKLSTSRRDLRLQYTSELGRAGEEEASWTRRHWLDKLFESHDIYS
jgi:hypothetical protein